MFLHHQVTSPISGDSTSQISTMELEGLTTDSTLGEDASSLSPVRKTSSMLSVDNVTNTSTRRRMITVPKSSILKTHPIGSTSHSSTKTVSIDHNFAKPTRSIEISKKKVVEKLIPQKRNNSNKILKIKLKSEESLWKQNYTDVGCNTFSSASISKRYDGMFQKRKLCVNSKGTQKSLPLRNGSVYSRGVQVFLRSPTTVIPLGPSINKSCYTYVRTADCGTQYVNTALIDEIREKYKYATYLNITHRPIYNSLTSSNKQNMIEYQKRLIEGARRWNIPHSYEHMCFA